MSLSSTTSRVSYAGNGATTAFSFPYYFLSNSDLVVIVRVTATGVETVKTITTHYTVSGAGNSGGGTVTMLSAPASGETLIIYRDPEITQPTDWVENDPSPAETKEQAFDRLTMIAQRLEDRLDRSVRLTDGNSQSSFSPLLPSLIEASQMLRVKSDLSGWEFVTASEFTFDESSPLTTKGDIIVHDGSVNTRLGVGSNGQFLTADSARTTGLKWDTLDLNTYAPATTKGDLIVRNSTVLARLPVGVNNTVLVADSAETTGVKWATISSVGLAVASKTTTYTLTSSDDAILADATGGGFTLTIPSAATNTGKKYYIKKTDSSANIVTLGGALSTTLNTQNESLVIISDGSTWEIFERKIPSVWTQFTMSITATANPTKGGGTTLDKAYWRRVGDSIELRYEYKHTSGGSAGTGNYVYNIPNSWTADSNKVTLGPGTFESSLGHGVIYDTSTFSAFHVMANAGGTGVNLVIDADGAYHSATRYSLGSTELHFSFKCIVPISGWNG